MTRKKTKVFCIGFQKTGTTSMKHALRILGYRVAGPNGVHHSKIAKKITPFTERLSKQYDAFQDNPWPLLYKEMDALHPGSKFILTLRDTDAWLKSVVKHFGTRTNPMHEWIYGIGKGHPLGNEASHAARYDAHNAAVIEYFKDRPEDLLVIDVAKGDDWGKICEFLCEPIPDTPFPHANKASSRLEKRSLPIAIWKGFANACKKQINKIR